MAQKWFRVKDKRTGHEYSVARVQEDKHQVLDKPAAGPNGRPLPAKPNQKLPSGGGSKSAETTEASSGSTSTSSGETKKEGTK